MWAREIFQWLFSPSFKIFLQILSQWQDVNDVHGNSLLFIATICKEITDLSHAEFNRSELSIPQSCCNNSTECINETETWNSNFFVGTPSLQSHSSYCGHINSHISFHLGWFVDFQSSHYATIMKLQQCSVRRVCWRQTSASSFLHTSRTHLQTFHKDTEVRSSLQHHLIKVTIPLEILPVKHGKHYVHKHKSFISFTFLTLIETKAGNEAHDIFRIPSSPLMNNLRNMQIFKSSRSWKNLVAWKL